ncbi:MAG TPA: FHA domain-containing protein [Verrucomicrobiae bacterium]|jgi:predicted component of type VI protein secretion system|nr:FHA domain-containing protein [Verrucomicrobiae bacterium]
MAKLVVLNAGLSGRSHELTVDKTTIGRVDDNTFQLADGSISSHHCEILLRGSDVVVKDLNSTNGTFINGEQITETVLKPGQTLRLGQVEMRLETDGVSSPIPSSGNAPAPTTAPAPASSAKRMDQTVVMQRGVSLNELEQGPRSGGFDTTSKAFSKKDNKTNRMFLIGGIVLVVIILLVLLVALMTVPRSR